MNLDALKSVFFIEENNMSLDSPSNIQIGGNHYKKFQYQPIHFLMDITCNSALSYAIKYVSRYPNKNPDDLDKAIHCLRLYEEWVIKGFENEEFIGEQAQLDFLKIQKFTSQFEPKVASVIQAILVLGNVLSFIDEEGSLNVPDLNNTVDNVIDLVKVLKNED